MLSSRSSAIVRFDRFELDLVREELLFEGVATAIQPQPLRALVLLVTQAGKLVTREQLQDHLWSDVSATDVERSLNHSIRKLRQVLSDDARRPRFVQTVARRGYRFIGELEEPMPEVGSIVTRAQLPGGSPSEMLLPEDLPTPIIRLRISGFQEIVDDRAWPLISEGVVEELTSRLVGLRKVGLAVLDDSFAAAPPVGEGRQGFYGLKGCVRRSGAKVRVSAHLAQHPYGALVATTVFEQELGNVFDLQGLASQRIVEDLILPLLKAARPDADLELDSIAP